MLANYFSENLFVQALISILDISLVWLLVYISLTLLKGTRGLQLVKGIFIIFALRFIFNLFGFKTMSFIIDQIVTWGVLASIIIFQPEIRRTLERMGRFNMTSLFFNKKVTTNKSTIITAIIDSTRHMARRRIGALIILENYTGLDEYIESGITLNAEISNELLINIFIPNSPLHDGAVIIRESTIKAASCFLPLSDSSNISSKFGTRHRAAIGLSEITDALAITVSEETGHISLAMNGRLLTELDNEKLRRLLDEHWSMRTTNLGGVE
ncbi:MULTISPECIES: diadenylate cyclase CdaA [unclassified Gemella]|uniref:diadenylate cyclase CdaA n=1 Tax=unclassified Gemella TaxID=2624949 RepID=UPI00107495A2|nr:MULTISPECIES: diadenylate cyclase CdaA [unclassified Gemella]MBF0710370.1 TIGR00159 family protein [Gemella sp. GL1.1]MBF0747180.1 TIGR00159 family protein [Gemella sp. 19428wG2_WT2a]NYS27714.1 TIGR00159 family protein [Gemella sp. GL1]TFU58183.1 TIGR00159 family protein [Gemella sp. WT2a]